MRPPPIISKNLFPVPWGTAKKWGPRYNRLVKTNTNQWRAQMTSTNTIEQQTEIRVLENEEVDCVAGGNFFDVLGMPDRREMCGTLWLWLQRGRIPTGPQQ